MNRILVTGGSGFIGSFLVERLVRENYKVSVLDNNFRGRKSYLDSVMDRIEFVEADITRPQGLHDKLSGFDTVYHLAAINGTKYFYEMPKQVLKVNMQGTINVIEALEKSSVKKFVYFSSSEIYGKPEQFPTDESHRLIVDDPKNPRWTYSASKIMGEIYTNTHCKSLGIDYAIIRPHNFYGPRMGNEHVIPEFIRRIVKNEEFTIQGDGSQRRSFCYIGDAIEAVVQAGARKTNGEAFNIGNDTEEYTILEVANLVAKAAGVKISPKFVELPKGGTTRRKPSIEKARKLLGYNPKVGLEEGIGLTYAWYKDDLKGR